MVALLGFENSEKPCEIEAWQVAHTQISAQEFEAMKSEALEVLKSWPRLPLPLKAAILGIIRSFETQ